MSENNQRLSAAIVKDLYNLSPTVKKLVLKIDDPQFVFKAGQWIDFHIPGVSVVGGFSMCSSPNLLQQNRLIELAVKRSTHPPAAWVHGKCSVGSLVKVAVGGSFFFDPRPGDAPVDLLLIAGGVGINPIRSIVAHNSDLRKAYDTNKSAYCRGKIALLYASRSLDELISKEDFCAESPANISCEAFISQPSLTDTQHNLAKFNSGRITGDHIKTAIMRQKSHTKSSGLLCYLCGPSELVNSLVPSIRECGIEDDNIIYENWPSPTVN